MQKDLDDGTRDSELPRTGHSLTVVEWDPRSHCYQQAMCLLRQSEPGSTLQCSSMGENMLTQRKVPDSQMMVQAEESCERLQSMESECYMS